MELSGEGALRGDEQINVAPDLSVDVQLSWAAAGPGIPGNGSGLKRSAGCTENRTRRPNIRPIRWKIVILVVGRTKNK